jgi:hypothetical protein
MPQRRWRFFSWQGWLRARGDEVWHARLALHIARLLSRRDTVAGRDPAALVNSLEPELRSILVHAQVPPADQEIALQTLQNQAPAFRLQAGHIQPEVSTTTEVSPRGVIQDAPERNQLQQFFTLALAIPSEPALPVLSGRESLFSGSLGSDPTSPKISVTLREANADQLTVIVAIVGTRRWQVELLLDGKVIAQATTDKDGIAELTELTRDLLQQKQIALRCRELPPPEQNNQQEEE